MASVKSEMRASLFSRKKKGSRHCIFVHYGLPFILATSYLRGSDDESRKGQPTEDATAIPIAIPKTPALDPRGGFDSQAAISHTEQCGNSPGARPHGVFDRFQRVSSGIVQRDPAPQGDGPGKYQQTLASAEKEVALAFLFDDPNLLDFAPSRCRSHQILEWGSCRSAPGGNRSG